MQVEHGDAQADRRVLDGEKRFFLLGHAEAEARVLREAVAFAGDAEEILIELFVPVLVVIECDRIAAGGRGLQAQRRSDEHTSELQSLMRISYAVFCLKKKN